MNPVVHFEIPFDDEEKAKEFYEKVFEWKIQPVPDMPYWMAYTGPTNPETFMLEKSGMINGGMYKRGDQGAKSPVLVIDVPNIEEHIEKIKSAGGEITMEKTKVGDMGFYAQFKDTQGNILGIWESIKKE